MQGKTEEGAGGAPGSGTGDGMLAARPARQGEFVARNIAGETILVPVRGRKGDLEAIYNLNEVAGYIWNRIDGRTSVRELIDGVCSEFDVTPERAEADTREFVAALQEAGLVAATPATED
jgi:hypothetical protein